MRLLVFTLFFIYSTLTFAAEIRTTDAFEHPSLFELADFQDTLQQDGFWSVDGQNVGMSHVIGVDQIFTDSGFHQTVYLKLGLQQFEPASLNSVAGGLAYQGVTRSGVPYVLFFDNISETRAKEIAQHVNHPDESAGLTKNRASLALRLLIPRAHATCPHGVVQNQIGKTLNDLDGVLGFRALATCTVSALENSVQSLAAPLVSLKNLVQNPEKFWNTEKKEWQNLKHFVTNIRAELSSFFSTLEGIDAQMIEQVACMMIGQVATGIGLAVLTGGLAAGTAAKTSVAIAAMIAKLNRLRPVLQSISRMKQMKRVHSLFGVSQKVLNCAAH